MEILTPRDVPLGGLRAMTVRRTLPQRQRTLIGAWCFVDHYGPDRVFESGGMDVPPHPHTGLQTASWLFEGEIEHRDSAGNHAMVRPGELNLMTAGSGISHSERTTTSADILAGIQLWIALPDQSRFTDAGFEHYAPPLIEGPGWRARVFLGSLLGDSSPVRTHTPLLGVELSLDAGARLDLAVDPAFEHGVLVDHGALEVEGRQLRRGELAYLEPGADQILLTVSQSTRILLLGGPPFDEQIVMWWNFIARSHEEIEQWRADWQAEISGSTAHSRYGLPEGDPGDPLPAPVLPGVRLQPRG